MRITYLSFAVQDLAEILAYFSVDNPDAARRVSQRLKKTIDSLTRFPSLGKPGRVFGTRELITPKIGKTAYVVVYRMKREDIQILRVLPGMRDLETILGEGFPEEEN
jgi:toxin ParE1/3/4